MRLAGTARQYSKKAIPQLISTTCHSARHQGGLDFGYADEEPDYWDFVHFAIVIGATSQTADIVFKSRAMRRVGTLHSVVAFGFNTAILATMINLAAGLF